MAPNGGVQGTTAKLQPAVQGVPGALLRCCREFQALLAQNEALPPHERLPESDFEVDPGLHDMVEAERKEQESLVRQVSHASAVRAALLGRQCMVQTSGA